MKPNIPVKLWRALREYAEKQEEIARQRQAWQGFRRAKEAQHEAYFTVSNRGEK